MFFEPGLIFLVVAVGVYINVLALFMNWTLASVGRGKASTHVFFSAAVRVQMGKLATPSLSAMAVAHCVVMGFIIFCFAKNNILSSTVSPLLSVSTVGRFWLTLDSCIVCPIFRARSPVIIGSV